MISLIEEVRTNQPDFHQVYLEHSTKFNRFDGYRNNCSNTVRKFLSLLGTNVYSVTAWADTIRNLGPINFNPKQLEIGDVVAMGRPGDTWHVGVYFGNNKVLHQSAMRGYRVGVYPDLNAFVNYRRGFYFVRPSYSYQKLLERQFFVAPDIS